MVFNFLWGGYRQAVWNLLPTQACKPKGLPINAYFSNSKHINELSIAEAKNVFINSLPRIVLLFIYFTFVCVYGMQKTKLIEIP